MISVSIGAHGWNAPTTRAIWAAIVRTGRLPTSSTESRRRPVLQPASKWPWYAWEKVYPLPDLQHGLTVLVPGKKTEDRGYGLRATRSFDPGQIIVEYTGEIITQEEGGRRLEEVYKDNQVATPFSSQQCRRFYLPETELLPDAF